MAALHLLLPLLLTAQIEQADEAFRAGDFEHAGTLAREALRRDPSAVHAHMILGVVAARSEDWAASDRHFRNVIRLQPSNAFGYFYLGQARLYQKQWLPAIQSFRRARARSYPDTDRLRVELALALNEHGQPKEALNELQGDPPQDQHLAAQFYAVTAFARDRLGQTATAIESARQALAVDDTNPLVWDFVIEALIRSDEAPAALAAAIRAQKKFPDRGDTQYLFALASHHVVESPLSKLALRNLEEAEPGSARVALAEGLALRKQGRTEEALAAFENAARRGAPDAHLLLGILRKEGGDYAAAERELRAATRQNPRNGQAFLELGKLLFSRGDLPGARLRLETAEGLMPEASTVHYQLGLLYRRLGLTGKAAEQLSRVRNTGAAAK
ncbi:MAG: tetratricopeptide repeat protein [Bryobacteraceae bacterium]